MMKTYEEYIELQAAPNVLKDYAGVPAEDLDPALARLVNQKFHLMLIQGWDSAGDGTDAIRDYWYLLNCLRSFCSYLRCPEKVADLEARVIQFQKTCVRETGVDPEMSWPIAL